MSLSSADAAVVDAVAPYNAESQVNADIVDLRLSNVINQAFEDCIAAEGLPGVDLVTPIPSREALLGKMLPDFPDVESMARDGFRPISEDDIFTDADIEASTFTDAQVDVMNECEESEEFQRAESLRQDYGALRGAWQEVMNEIDALDEVEDERADFSSCLEEGGIVSDYALSEHHFVESVTLQTTSATSFDEANSIRADLGRLFIECGRDLLELKEELRSGDRRDAFLELHGGSIAELSENLFGAGLMDETDAG